MNQKAFRFVIYVVLIIFLLLYFFGSNIYQNKLTEKRDLTTSQINKFEEDIKNGVEIDINDYLVKEKNYNNLITNTNNGISKLLERSFKKIFEILLKNVDV